MESPIWIDCQEGFPRILQSNAHILKQCKHTFEGEFCQLPSCVSCVKSILWIGPLRQEKDAILLYVYFPCNNLLSYIAILVLEYSVTDENHTRT